MSKFVHLHNHTHYSLLDGAIKTANMIVEAKAHDMESIAITDHGNMFGVIDFYREAIKAGIKPIVGVEAYVSPVKIRDNGNIVKHDEYHHLILLAKNMKGYKNLIKLSTISYLEGFYRKPRIDDSMLEEFSEGLIGLSACIKGVIPSLLLNDKYEKAKDKALYYKDIFNGDFYIEVQDHGLESELYVKDNLIKLGNEIDTLVVATNDIHYLKKDHVFLRIQVRIFQRHP